MAGTSMAERWLISRSAQSAPLPNRMDQGIASVINRVRFYLKAPASMLILNAKRTAKGAITVMVDPNAMAAKLSVNHNVIIHAACTVNKGVIDVEENHLWDRLQCHC